MRTPRISFWTPLFFLLAATTHCLGQTVDLRGVVKDASTGNLIPGAIIRLEGTELRDTSDANGEFRIADWPATLFPGRPIFHQTGSGLVHMKIYQFAPARKVAEYSSRLTAGWYEWPQPRLPAGLYIQEIRAANSVTRQRFLSLGQGAPVAHPQPIRLYASGHPVLAKAKAGRTPLTGTKPGFFPRRLAVDTLVLDGMTVWLRKLGSFDGLWIGKTGSQDTFMMAIEGDTLAYLRGPDSLVADRCAFRRIFQVPSIFLPAMPSGHIANDSVTGGVPVDLPNGRYEFGMTGGFASDSIASGEMNLHVVQPWDTLGGPECAGSLQASWAAEKSRFAAGIDGSWKGVDSKGDSLRFEVVKGRVDAYDFDIHFGTPQCGRSGGFGTTGFPYWVLPDGRFSISQVERESDDTPAFSYLLNGRFTGPLTASGTSVFTFSNSPSQVPACAIRDTVTWTANRQP